MVPKWCHHWWAHQLQQFNVKVSGPASQNKGSHGDSYVMWGETWSWLDRSNVNTFVLSESDKIAGLFPAQWQCLHAVWPCVYFQKNLCDIPQPLQRENPGPSDNLCQDGDIHDADEDQDRELDSREEAQEAPKMAPDGGTICEAGEQATVPEYDDPRGVTVGGISGHSMMKPTLVAVW